MTTTEKISVLSRRYERVSAFVVLFADLAVSDI